MTVQEAIKSGKRFRRSEIHLNWMSYDGEVTYIGDKKYLIWYKYTTHDVLATDWEVEVIKKELSAEDIQKGIELWLTAEPIEPIGTFLIKHLGLE